METTRKGINRLCVSKLVFLLLSLLILPVTIIKSDTAFSDLSRPVSYTLLAAALLILIVLVAASLLELSGLYCLRKDRKLGWSLILNVLLFSMYILLILFPENRQIYFVCLYPVNIIPLIATYLELSGVKEVTGEKSNPRFGKLDGLVLCVLCLRTLTNIAQNLTGGNYRIAAVSLSLVFYALFFLFMRAARKII